MSLNVRRYAEISKVEDQGDGTIKVWGYASSEAIDSDGETITADAMKAAIPDYMKFGAVREMHQPIAAGTALELEVQDDGKTAICAHVVDPIAVKKVQTGVYKGFSIGGKVTKRDPNDAKKITGLKLIENSLVDRPANPEAVFTMYKAEGIEDESTDLQKSAVEELGTLVNEKQILPAELLALAKAEIVRKSAPAVEPPAKPSSDDLKKGIRSMCEFAQLLQALTWLASDVAYETAYENDGSQVPAQLREWLKVGVTIFASMSAEEVAELIASIKPIEVQMTTVTAADKTGDLNKAGARFSTATKGALADIHKSMKDCCEKMNSLGYDVDEDAEDTGEGKDPKAKADTVLDVVKTEVAEPVNKTELGDLLKAELAKRDGVIDELQKRLKVVEAQPAPAKGVTRVVVGKSDDVLSADPKKVDPIVKHDGSIDDAATEIKKVHAAGGTLVRF
jgi:phage head maturation protease